jgi:3-oxoacyl-[acyl-carrier-protein] synthase II
MTISVQGIGWVTKEGFGCVRSGRREIFDAGDGVSVLQKQGLFSHPFKNFGRLDAVSKSVSYAVALALRDAGIEYSSQRKQQIGIVGTNREGSLRTDMAYFQDYIRSGRTLSRANLFIYTLPSSPLGEAAIHFGLLGPVLYAASGRGSLYPLLDLASDMIQGDEASIMLAGAAEEEEAVFFVTGRHSAERPLCSIQEAEMALSAAAAVPEIVRRFSLFSARKGLA